MYRAQALGMTGPDYVYLFYTMMQTSETLQPWEDGTSMSTDERTTRMDAFHSMKQVSMQQLSLEVLTAKQTN